MSLARGWNAVTMSMGSMEQTCLWCANIILITLHQGHDKQYTRNINDQLTFSCINNPELYIIDFIFLEN